LVLAAYDHRCAISNLPDDHLLDAAHIMADAHELMGQPVVANGIALSKIHHAAFDNHLIGIDPTAACTSRSGYWPSTTARSSSRA
jgi:putative restriction endonuclease